MPEFSLKNSRQWFFLWAGLLFFSLLSRPPLPVDETRYLSVAWEMWFNKQFLVPLSNGLPYSHKPPLLFWLIDLGWWFFGVNQWTARLTAPLFGLGSILITMGLAKMLWPENEKIRQTIPFILLATFFWSFFGTLTMFDMLIVFFSLLAHLGLLKVWHTQKKFWWILVSLAVGLGILAKGPVILLYILPPAVLAPWWSDRYTIWWPGWYVGLLLSLAGGIILALCWAIPAALTGGEAYRQAILFGQIAGRMVHSFSHQRPFYFYAALAPLILFPWFFWVPFWRGVKKLKTDNSTRFCLSTTIPAFLLLSFVSGKQVHYMLPLLPYVALFISRASFNNAPWTFFSDRWAISLVYFVLGLTLLLLPHFHSDGGDGTMLAYIPSWIGIIPLLGCFIILFMNYNEPGRQARALAYINILLLIALQFGISGVLHNLFEPASIIAAVQETQQKGHLVAAAPAVSHDQLPLADQFQFAGRLTQPLPVMRNLVELLIWAQKNTEQYCIIFTRDKDHKLLTGRGTETQYKDGWLIFRPVKGLSADYAGFSQQ